MGTNEGSIGRLEDPHTQNIIYQGRAKKDGKNEHTLLELWILLR
jgi:hypothetical protein